MSVWEYPKSENHDIQNPGTPIWKINLLTPMGVNNKSLTLSYNYTSVTYYTYEWYDFQIISASDQLQTKKHIATLSISAKQSTSESPLEGDQGTPITPGSVKSSTESFFLKFRIKKIYWSFFSYTLRQKNLLKNKILHSILALTFARAAGKFFLIMFKVLPQTKISKV